VYTRSRAHIVGGVVYGHASAAGGVRLCTVLAFSRALRCTGSFLHWYVHCVQLASPHPRVWAGAQPHPRTYSTAYVMHEYKEEYFEDAALTISRKGVLLLDKR
jgi:hypothetical protein